jgi:teichuronic acid biosynthesis glycosyltransferase TuaC
MINILLITLNYPIGQNETRGVFVKKLVDFWSINHRVTVLFLRKHKNPINILKGPNIISLEGNVQLIEAPYFSFTGHRVLGFDLSVLSRFALWHSTKKTLPYISKPNIAFGKFLMSGGYIASRIKLELNIPAFADLGESTLLSSLSTKSRKDAEEIVTNLDGLFCVSSRLMAESRQLGAAHKKVFYTPNTVDLNIFKPLNRMACRVKLGIPLDLKLVIFVGHFVERKGPLRVLQAIRMIGEQVKCVFIGKGEQEPNGEEVYWKGIVKNKDLPIWLNSADVFVLPTIAEGNCNALNEAIACGIPIVSSDIPDIRDQINKDQGILVPPLNILKLADAINLILNNPKLAENFKKHNLAVSSSRFKRERADKILNYLFGNV